MEQKNHTTQRILAIAPTNRGFGYIVMEGKDKILAASRKAIDGKGKNKRCLVQVEKLIAQWLPHAVLLQDANGKDSRRAPRIKQLQKQIQDFAQSHGIAVVQYSGRKIREALVDDPKGTKYEMAVTIAKLFPNELGDKLPPKRKPWQDEHWNMCIFEAAALVIVYSTSFRGKGDRNVLPIIDSNLPGLSISSRTPNSVLPIELNRQ